MWGVAPEVGRGNEGEDLKVVDKLKDVEIIIWLSLIVEIQAWQNSAAKYWIVKVAKEFDG